MARLQDIIVGSVLVLTVTVLLHTRPAEAGAPEPPADVCTEGGNECKNGGTCDTNSTQTACKCAPYMGVTCEDECEGNDDCGTDGTCGDTSPKKCTCKDSAKEGPGCTNDKSGASAVKSFSLMSLFVILTGYLL